MTYVNITEFETRLQGQGGRSAVLSGDRAPAIPLGEHPCGLEQWNPETLLVGAVEGRTHQVFLEQARAQGVEILFYQSTAMARRVEGPDGCPRYTDLIVRPHVAVRGEREAAQVRRIFQLLPERCFPSSMLRLTPRIEPIIDIWDEQRVAAFREESRRGWRPGSPP